MPSKIGKIKEVDTFYYTKYPFISISSIVYNLALFWVIPMECWKGRFSMKYIFRSWYLEEKKNTFFDKYFYEFIFMTFFDKYFMNFFDTFFYEILCKGIFMTKFLTNLFDELFWRVFLWRIFDEWFWRILIFWKILNFLCHVYFACVFFG